ncbi:hypothetical protein FH972_000301 [Carpinus fangiana]|uniref:Apple domain-containing protein n=1 Tax=Carpinus fangiana TaxID=176857 RepID=A0A5N6Q8H1_9ROSI|nr:hypothetical protein FH972_000301 [Carpinus fangiana]
MSKEKNFALGFFNPGNSSYWYLGVWYFKVTANRNNPINGSSGVLSINQYGNLVPRDGSNHLLWTTNVSVQGTISTVAQLQDSGNLVLVHSSCIRVRPPLWRSGPWPWISPAAETGSTDIKTNFVYNQDEMSFSYFLDDPSIIRRLAVNSSGLYQRLMWNGGDHQWKELWSTPRYRCDKYGHCGYEPKSPRDWSLRNGSVGCVRKQLGLSMCRNGEGFVNVGRVKTPDSPDAYLLDRSISGAEGEAGCLRNCSCTAFMSLNVDGKGIGCWTWYGDLVDIEAI